MATLASELYPQELVSSRSDVLTFWYWVWLTKE